MLTDSEDTLADAVLALPAQQRADLALRIMESLEDASDPDAEAAWDEEIRSRVEEIRSGTAVLVPVEDAAPTSPPRPHA